ncbi:MAG TPA: gliding motility protein GldM [Cytophagales bacterium]|jgi:gliding motility-associated protein GldM|nr:gliding motility protein GldM [Cytophagales bacterium]
MAGGKETPRQKMIGLMYLVLTAMLALNVDSAVLDKFLFINNILETQAQENAEVNSGKVKSIAMTVEEKGNREGDVQVLDRAKQVRSQTTEMVNYLRNTKEEIIKLTGGYDEDKNLKGAKDMDHVADLMIRQKKGMEMKDKLNEYAQNLSQITGNNYPPIAFDGKNHPYFSTQPSQRSKNFAELNFESTPTAAGLATITQFQNEVLNYEAEALEFLKGQVGAKDIAFDVIVPMVLPESKVVASGAKYKAKMFISASASGNTPTMKFNGNSVSVDEEGYGNIEFVAKGDKYDKDGQQVKKFLAEISLNDTTFRQEIEYVVAKPVIQIQSASVQALYANCGNKLNVQVPALGSAYNPSFRVKGGQSYSGKGGQVTIVPDRTKEVVLNVYSDGNFIGTQSFNVRGIPKPDIVMTSGGREVDEKRGMSKPPREITLVAEPDESFKQFLPEDARYRVTKWEVILARGTRALETQRVTGPRANITSFAAKARQGDRIVIEVKEVQRMNFRDQTETVSIPMGARIKQIPIN